MYYVTPATVNYWKFLKIWPSVSSLSPISLSSYLHHSVDLPHIYHLLYTASSNQSSHAHEYPDCQEGGNEASLLVSPLVVAGIVIGLVLFLSCVTIIVGSLRKDSRLHNPHLRASYGQWSNFMGSRTYQSHLMALFVVSVCIMTCIPSWFVFKKLRGISLSMYSAFVWEFRQWRPIFA